MRSRNTIVSLAVVWCVALACSPIDPPPTLPPESDAGPDAGDVPDARDAGRDGVDASDGGGTGRRDPGSGGTGWTLVGDKGGAGGASGAGGAGGAMIVAFSGQSGSGGGSSGGAGGAGGTPPPKREPCEANGAVRCAASGVAGARERCAVTQWQPEASCAADEVCSDRPQPGACQKVAAVCKGSAGKSVCDSAGVMYDCDELGVITDRRACTSVRHCQPGVEKRMCLNCIPGEYRCSGADLERCVEDGQAFAMEKRCDTAALCNAVAGDCTTATCKPMQYVCQADKLRQCNADQTALMDVSQCQPGWCDAAGGQCDVCAPGSKGCDGNTVMTCNAQGQGSTREDCPPEKSLCVGMGQCVECATADDCPDPGACKERYCNTGTGKCAPRNAADGGMCSSGDVTGTCSRGSCDLCSPNPCENGGKCSATAVAISCMCGPGYSGARCEVDPCSPNPCQHGGMCSVGAGGASCSCSGGYTGAKCEVDGCSPNPCQHGGTCTRTGDGGHSCACTGGYAGKDCEVDACSPNPCQNGGKCTRTSGGGHTCACTGGYTGTNCETDPCKPSPCPAGTTCTRTAMGAMCGATCAPSCNVGDACTSGNECASSVCTNNKCACSKVEDCSALKPADCQVAACNAGSCELQTAPAGASCGKGGTCSAGGKCELCGDGVISGNEDCEISAPGWGVQTCGADCKRKYYRSCKSAADCDPAQYCNTTLGLCTSVCDNAGPMPVTSTACLSNPLGPAPMCSSTFCILPCKVDGDCPADLPTCTLAPGSTYSTCANLAR
jgi:EGF-like domain